MSDVFERFSFAVSEITRCWRKLAAEELAKYGLKSPHARYLMTMNKYPQGIAVPTFCEITGKDKSDASRMIAILEKKGFARKKDVGGSLYRGLWVLTEEGKKAAENVSSRVNKAVELVSKGLSDEVRVIFLSTLEKVTENLTDLCRVGLCE